MTIGCSAWRHLSTPTNALIAFALMAVFATASGDARAQQPNPQSYGEVPGVAGKVEITVVVKPGEYATLFAVAQASGGKPVGNGIVTRAGLGVDIYVDDKICTADRDIRRQVDVRNFEGKFATSATCLKVLKPGTHTILAEKTSVNVEGSQMILKYSIPGGNVEAKLKNK